MVHSIRYLTLLTKVHDLRSVKINKKRQGKNEGALDKLREPGYLISMTKAEDLNS